MLTGSERLKEIGQTPSMRDSVLGMIDQATGNKLQPHGALEKATDFASELLVPAGAASKANELKNPLDAVKGGLNPTGLLKNWPDIKKMDSEDLRKASSEIYKQAEKKGGILKSEFTNKFLDEVGKTTPQTTAGKILSGDSPITKLHERMQGLKDKAISLAEAQEIDEFLGDTIDSFTENGRLNKQGKKILDVQTTLRSMIDGNAEHAPNHDANARSYGVWGGDRNNVTLLFVVSHGDGPGVRCVWWVGLGLRCYGAAS